MPESRAMSSRRAADVSSGSSCSCIVPKVKGLTFTPVRPRVRYSMDGPHPSPGDAGILPRPAILDPMSAAGQGLDGHHRRVATGPEGARDYGTTHRRGHAGAETCYPPREPNGSAAARLTST